MKISFFNLKRQDLIYLKDSKSVQIETSCDDYEKNFLGKWFASGFPVIVRRPFMSECRTRINCGIPLPPDEGKRRIALSVPLDCIDRIEALPSVSEGLGIAERHGRTDLRLFAESCEKHNFSASCFGSIAWEKITGKKYFRRSSDIDIQFTVSGSGELRKLVTFLETSSDTAVNYDIEITLWNGDSFSWREFINSSKDLMMKTSIDVFLLNKDALRKINISDSSIASVVAYEAFSALREELDTFPKPGLVSHFDSGSHSDMDASIFMKSIHALRQYFYDMAISGIKGFGMSELRKLGLAAEKEMFAATSGINTHKGAIFSLGLLAAGAGHKIKHSSSSTLGQTVRKLWADGILSPLDNSLETNGARARKTYGLGGAAEEAAGGFPSIYEKGLPSFIRSLNRHSRNTARLSAFFSILETANDTTILHRGGLEGMEFARKSASALMKNFINETDEWMNELIKTHSYFIEKNLSPGGVADLLAATIFIHRIDELCQD